MRPRMAPNHRARKGRSMIKQILPQKGPNEDLDTPPYISIPIMTTSADKTLPPHKPRASTTIPTTVRPPGPSPIRLTTTWTEAPEKQSKATKYTTIWRKAREPGVSHFIVEAAIAEFYSIKWRAMICQRTVWIPMSYKTMSLTMAWLHFCSSSVDYSSFSILYRRTVFILFFDYR